MLSLFFFLPSVIPLSLAHTLSTIIGRIGYYFPGTYRNQAMANLRLAFGKEKSPSELRHLIRDVGVAVTKTVFEFMYSLNPQKEKLYGSVTIEGSEHLDAALRRGKGVRSDFGASS